MGRLTWYDTTSNNDNVTDDGNVDGWATSAVAYGAQIANGRAYRFGPVLNTPNNQRWFANHFYTTTGANDRLRILAMIGGQIHYP